MEDDATRSAVLTALTTEHFVLQSAASSTVSDAAARSSLYVFSMSSTVVASGFISQSRDVFVPFIAAVLPALFLLGVFTVVRLVDTVLENNQCLAGIARIRGYYRTLSPDAATVFAAEYGRWPEAAPAPALGLGRTLAFLGTTASMIAFINSVVAGVGIALLVTAAAGGDQMGLGLIFGVVTVALLMGAFLAYERWRFRVADVATADATTTSDT
jgi:hypothetical protein